MNPKTDTPARRAEDHDRVAAFNALWDRWSKMLMPVLLGAFGFFVSDIWSPIREVPHIQAQQITLMRNDSIGRLERGDMRVILSILVKMQCLQLSDADRAKTMLECGNVPAPNPEVLRRILRESPLTNPP